MCVENPCRESVLRLESPLLHSGITGEVVISGENFLLTNQFCRVELDPT